MVYKTTNARKVSLGVDGLALTNKGKKMSQLADVISYENHNIDDENVILYATEDNKKNVSILVLKKSNFIALNPAFGPARDLVCPKTGQNKLRLIPQSIARKIVVEEVEDL